MVFGTLRTLDIRIGGVPEDASDLRGVMRGGRGAPRAGTGDADAAIAPSGARTPIIVSARKRRYKAFRAFPAVCGWPRGCQGRRMAQLVRTRWVVGQVGSRR